MKNIDDDMLLLPYLTYFKYLGKPFLAIKKTFSTSKGLALAAPTVYYISTFHVENQALLFLGILYFVDFITGLMVSFKVAKESAIKKGVYKELIFEGSGYSSYMKYLLVRGMFKIRFYAEVISSSKIKLSILKGVVYMMFIVLAKTIQMMFKLKPFSFDISPIEWSITLIVICVCCACEAHSIFIENFTKLGFNMLDRVFSVFKTYKKYKSQIEE